MLPEDKLDSLRARYHELTDMLCRPEVAGDGARFTACSKERGELEPVVLAYERYVKVKAQIRDDREALTDPTLRDMVLEELPGLEVEQKKLEADLQLLLLPRDPNDARNTVFEIRSGTGGEEAALFASDLFRMYSRYAEARGWKVETLDSSPSDLGGFKEIIFTVTGTDVYKRLKHESGVHRVQRVPATEAQGRVHTSTATVAVLPEAQEVDVEIRPDDIVVSVCRASGKGGQGVNTTDSAVQIQHKPSGLTVRCADERSQIKNRAKAMTVLRSRLLERKIAEENARYAAVRKDQVGTGERSEKIRTYNFPQNRITDHRIDLTLYNLANVIEGDIDPLIEPLMNHELESKLKAINN